MPPRLYWATQFLTARSEHPRASGDVGGGPSLLGEDDGLDALPGCASGGWRRPGPGVGPGCDGRRRAWMRPPCSDSGGPILPNRQPAEDRVEIFRVPYKGTGSGPDSANPDANLDRGQKPTCERRCRRPKSLRHAGRMSLALEPF